MRVIKCVSIIDIVLSKDPTPCALHPRSLTRSCLVLSPFACPASKSCIPAIAAAMQRALVIKRAGPCPVLMLAQLQARIRSPQPPTTKTRRGDTTNPTQPNPLQSGLNWNWATKCVCCEIPDRLQSRPTSSATFRPPSYRIARWGLGVEGWVRLFSIHPHGPLQQAWKAM